MTESSPRDAVIDRLVHATRGSGYRCEPWGIAVEVAVEIAVNGAPFTVMMATPADLEDLAVGLAYTERVLADVAAITAITVQHYLEGVVVDIAAPASSLDTTAIRRRTLRGTTGCGLCGVDALSAMPMQPGRANTARPIIEAAAVARAFAELPDHQPYNRATHSIHGAAWCGTDGMILVAREDVGRHNALDKVIGALARAGRLDESGFLAMTSRCSFELVYKAASTRAGALATLSAPTSLALEWSKSLGLPLVCRGRDDEIVRFQSGSARAP